MRTKQYQIDIFAKELRQNRYWLCECKYTKRPMGMKQVWKLEKAAKAFQKEERDRGLDVPDVTLWVICTGGFTEAVQKHITQKNDFYMSDHDDINRIFGAYGGNYNIPLFV
jgi:hypothetical protein